MYWNISLMSEYSGSSSRWTLTLDVLKFKKHVTIIKFRIRWTLTLDVLKLIKLKMKEQ